MKSKLIEILRRFRWTKFILSKVACLLFLSRSLLKTSKYRNKNDEIEAVIDIFFPRGHNNRLPLKLDMIESKIRYGSTFDEYFLYTFQHLSKRGRSSFVTDENRYHYYDCLNQSNDQDVFNNKYYTYQIFARYYKRDVVRVAEESDYDEFCKFVFKHPEFVRKPLSGCSGLGIEIVRTKDYPCIRACFGNIINCGAAVAEEIIKQTDEMALVNPGSVNTIRFTSVYIDEISMYNFTPYIKWGRGAMFHDNASSGGIFASVDLSTGIVFTPGFDIYGNEYILHPNSEAPIVGFQVPCWHNALNLIRDLAKVSPRNRLIGWDVAHTSSGWIMVEGNYGGQFVGVQTPSRRGKKRELDELVHQIKF